jgi:tRNA modification GTPase
MPIPFSVKERMGVESLMQAIEEKIAGIIPAERPVITRQRHRAHLEAALRHLQRYNLMRNQGIELRCEDLRRAAAEIGAITGRIPVDEVLGEIFSSFCIGK